MQFQAIIPLLVAWAVMSITKHQWILGTERSVATFMIVTRVIIATHRAEEEIKRRDELIKGEQ